MIRQRKKKVLSLNAESDIFGDIGDSFDENTFESSISGKFIQISEIVEKSAPVGQREDIIEITVGKIGENKKEGKEEIHVVFFDRNHVDGFTLEKDSGEVDSRRIGNWEESDSIVGVIIARVGSP